MFSLLFAATLAASPGHAAAPVVDRPAGDVDGDGVEDRFVATPWGAHRGDATHVRIESGRSHRVLWTADWIPGFGASFALLGDLDGDGAVEFAVGSPNESHLGMAGTGAIYVFSVRSQEARVVIPGERPHDAFGAAVVAMDLDDDGRVDLLGGRAGFGATRTPLFVIGDGGRTAVPGHTDGSLASLAR